MLTDAIEAYRPPLERIDFSAITPRSLRYDDVVHAFTRHHVREWIDDCPFLHTDTTSRYVPHRGTDRRRPPYHICQEQDGRIVITHEEGKRPHSFYFDWAGFYQQHPDGHSEPVMVRAKSGGVKHFRSIIASHLDVARGIYENHDLHLLFFCGFGRTDLRRAAQVRDRHQQVDFINLYPDRELLGDLISDYRRWSLNAAKRSLEGDLRLAL